MTRACLWRYIRSRCITRIGLRPGHSCFGLAWPRIGAVLTDWRRRRCLWALLLAVAVVWTRLFSCRIVGCFRLDYICPAPVGHFSSRVSELLCVVIFRRLKFGLLRVAVRRFRNLLRLPLPPQLHDEDVNGGMLVHCVHLTARHLAHGEVRFEQLQEPRVHRIRPQLIYYHHCAKHQGNGQDQCSYHIMMQQPQCIGTLHDSSQAQCVNRMALGSTYRVVLLDLRHIDNQSTDQSTGSKWSLPVDRWSTMASTVRRKSFTVSS